MADVKSGLLERCMVVKCPNERERFVFVNGVPVASVCPLHQARINEEPESWLLTQRLNEEPKIERID